MEHEREVRLYRRLCILVGAVYLVWWVAVEALLPNAYNALFGRLVVVGFVWSVVGASYRSAWGRDHIRELWSAGLWLLTAHYFFLFYENGGEINWVVGAFITVTAVSLGLLSRASLLAYSAFTTALSLAVVIALPPLRQSVFLPGLATVLLQANIGLNSRLAVLRDLVESNAHFQLLFDSTFEGVLIHDGGRVVQVNDALVGILGGTRDDVLGREVVGVLNADDPTGAHAALFDATSATELRCTRGERIIHLEVRSKPLRRTQRIVTISDISARKQHEQELRHTNDALAQSNLELQRFAYVASHDLQTPLRSIASFVDLLKMTYGDTLDSQARDWMGRIAGSAKHLQTLINDLLAYSRVDAERTTFASVPMREVLDQVTSLVDASDATITAGELPTIRGDRSQLVQLLQNLIGNALKYRGTEPPRVQIEVESRDTDWQFVVRDNGIGIAPQFHQQVFDVFKRLHGPKEYPGTGIGLAICRRVVDRHGGKIWVESEVGKGSAFFFTIVKQGGEP